MAKKDKKDENEKPEEFDAEEVMKNLAKKYGNIMFSGQDIKDRPRLIVPSTPNLDIANHGGIREGTWNLISGKKKTGKTTLALQIAANAQKMGKHIHYLNIEQRFDVKNLTTVRDLVTTPDKFTLYESTKGNILSAQKFLNLFYDICTDFPNSVVIIDSISSLCSDNELSKDIGEAARPEGPKLFGQVCRKLASTVPINGMIVLGILHLIANTSGYGPAFMEDGGNKIQYQCDNKFLCKSISSWENAKGRRIGQIVEWDVAFSANGAPAETATTFLRYGLGYDSVWEIVSTAIELNLIVKTGAWFAFEDREKNPVKCQGQDKVYDYFIQNPDLCEQLYAKVKELVCEE